MSEETVKANEVQDRRLRHIREAQPSTPEEKPKQEEPKIDAISKYRKMKEFEEKKKEIVRVRTYLFAGLGLICALITYSSFIDKVKIAIGSWTAILVAVLIIFTSYTRRVTQNYNKIISDGTSKGSFLSSGRLGMLVTVAEKFFKFKDLIEDSIDDIAIFLFSFIITALFLDFVQVKWSIRLSSII
eukprot:TRINITY_DN10692_c0_g1_i1.p1 TRINITY_DN10692_c0_g1~~TRINITY_DN10692_c0_g1_i1.p1  ORF type:complete len:186 (-),score=21.83 TRINITY_DN10692_c0_g1_i1:91-648(-)